MKKVLIGVAAAALALQVATATSIAAQSGMASWYKMGKVTASGERFRPMGLTAAHRSLPFGTKVRVTNLRNGRKVIVRINDRGPFIKRRIIDLSKGAALRIGLVRSGVARVRVDVLR